MTVKTKRYLELSDVLTLRLDCKSCGSTLEIPFAKDLGAKENANKLDKCPICFAPWASLGGSTYQPMVAGMVAAITLLRDTLKTNEALGFKLSVEVVDDKPVVSKA